MAAESALIGWTLSAFALGAVTGSLAASMLAARYDRRLLITGSMLVAVVPLLAMLWLPVGGAAFFTAVTLAGVLVYASFPLMIVSAQDLAPQAMATASGLLMGLALGIAGVLYIGVGWLQEAFGVTAALSVSFLALVPAALLAWSVLSRHLPDRPGLAHPAKETAAVPTPR